MRRDELFGFFFKCQMRAFTISVFILFVNVVQVTVAHNCQVQKSFDSTCP